MLYITTFTTRGFRPKGGVRQVRRTTHRSRRAKTGAYTLMTNSAARRFAILREQRCLDRPNEDYRPNSNGCWSGDPSKNAPIHISFMLTREWRNGRRAGLRIQCRKAWGFKSPLSHHTL